MTDERDDLVAALHNANATIRSLRAQLAKSEEHLGWNREWLRGSQAARETEGVESESRIAELEAQLAAATNTGGRGE